jgi:hypothetical protein
MTCDGVMVRVPADCMARGHNWWSCCFPVCKETTIESSKRWARRALQKSLAGSGSFFCILSLDIVGAWSGL